MRTNLCRIAVLALAGFCSGCAMCDNPYDYCGPVVDGGHHDAYGPHGGPGEGEVLMGEPHEVIVEADDDAGAPLAPIPPKKLGR